MQTAAFEFECGGERQVLVAATATRLGWQIHRRFATPNLYDTRRLPRERCGEADSESGRVTVDASTHQAGPQPVRSCCCCRGATLSAAPRMSKDAANASIADSIARRSSTRETATPLAF